MVLENLRNPRKERDERIEGVLIDRIHSETFCFEEMAGVPITKDERLTPIEMEELVRGYKKKRAEGKKEEADELEELIFSYIYPYLKATASKNTYYIRGFNDDAATTSIYIAYRYLLDNYEPKTYTHKAKTIPSGTSFWRHLDHYFKAKFQRAFVDNVYSESSLYDYRDRKTSEAKIKINIGYSEEEMARVEDDEFRKIIDMIERSDVNLRKELIEEIYRSLEKKMAESVLIMYDFSKGIKGKGVKERANEGVIILKNNQKIKELYDYSLLA